jgi:5'-3' exoribonuclease 2
VSIPTIIHDGYDSLANSFYSVNYEMPVTTHTHKSMLLRGLNMPTPALNRSDIEELRGKLRNAGRSFGGAPLGRGGYGDNRRGRINYGPDSGGRGGRQDRSQSYNNHHNNYNNNSYPGPNAFPPVPPPGWVPPPPGYPGFGAGLPPPPPPAHYGGGRDSYGGGNYGGGRGSHHQPPSNGSYGGYSNSGPPGRDQYGRDRRPYDDNRGGYRGGRNHR